MSPSPLSLNPFSLLTAMLVPAVFAAISLVSPALSYTWPNHRMDELEHLLVDTGGPDDGGIKAVRIIIQEEYPHTESRVWRLWTFDTEGMCPDYVLGSWTQRQMLIIYSLSYRLSLHALTM